MLEWTFSLGNALTIMSFLVGGSGLVYTIRGRVDAISVRLFSLENELKRMVDILVEQGRHAERMNAMDSRIANQGARLDDLTNRFNERADLSLNFK